MNGRRTGDTVSIDGGYQHRAMNSANPVQRFWHQTKRLLISELLPPARVDFVIDVGCGSGVITSYLGERAGQAVGIDGNPVAIDYARREFERENVTFMQTLADERLKLDAPPSKVYCMELIEHVYFEQGVTLLRNLRAVSQPGARMLLTTPNYRSLWPVIEWALDRYTDAPELGNQQHVTHYTAGRLRELAAAGGWDVEQVRTASFLAPWVAPLSWGLARFVHSVEVKARWAPGSILVGVLRARGAGESGAPAIEIAVSGDRVVRVRPGFDAGTLAGVVRADMGVPRRRRAHAACVKKADSGR